MPIVYMHDSAVYIHCHLLGRVLCIMNGDYDCCIMTLELYHGGLLELMIISNRPAKELDRP